jgi:peroxiredoxin
MAVATGRTSVADRTRTLKVGDKAPDFELSGHRNKERFRLSGLRGRKNVVIVFYPLDWTPV